VIYHLATPQEWAAARASGDFRFSTRDRSLEAEGFIHCSRWEQLPGVLERFYTGAGPLLLLVVDEDRLTAPWRDDEIAPGVFFPHVYGPVDLDAVVEVRPVEPQPDGSYSLG
jgi:glutathione S-transferase